MKSIHFLPSLRLAVWVQIFGWRVNYSLDLDRSQSNYFCASSSADAAIPKPVRALFGHSHSDFEISLRSESSVSRAIYLQPV